MAAPCRELERFENDVRRCMKCGFCAAFCPVFKLDRVERSLARGKNQLVKRVLDGEQELTSALGDILGRCLLCKTCVVNCPAKARVDRAVLAARADLVAARGLPLAKRLVFQHLLPRRRLFGSLLRVASWFSHALPGKGPVRHLPEFLQALGRGRHVPLVADVFLRQRLPALLAPPGGAAPRARVALFAGCAMEFVFPAAAEAIARTLASLGVQVAYDPRQGCCGAPVYMSGDFETGRAMARRNVEALEGYDLVVTGCATCASGLKEYAVYLPEDDAERERFERFAAKVRTFEQFLAGPPAPPGGRLRLREEYRGAKATWHDPCHLSRHQGIRAEPRAVLKGLEGLDFVEMPNADACCGLGGSFSIQYYELSRRIADEKIDGILASGADVVATACPGCIVQITDGLHRRRRPLPVVHLADLVEPAP